MPAIHRSNHWIIISVAITISIGIIIGIDIIISIAITISIGIIISIVITISIGIWGQVDWPQLICGDELTGINWGRVDWDQLGTS